MERGINYILIGVCFIASLLGLIIFIFWFSSSGIITDDSKIYKAYSKNAINGIRTDSIIKFKGINIGRVKDVNFKDKDFKEIVLNVEIRSDLPIKKGSYLKVSQSGIIGNSFLTLIQNTKSDEFIEKKEDFILNIQTNSMSKLLDDLPNITNKIDELLSNISIILSEENAQNITKVVTSIKDSANHLNKMIASLEKNTNNIDNLIKNTNEVVNNANQITKIVNKKIELGEFDFKTTLTPTLLSIEQSLNNINNLAKESSQVLENFQENPYNTIFGYRKEEKYDK